MTNACAAASARSSRLPFGFRLVVLPRYHPQPDGQTEAYCSIKSGKCRLWFTGIHFFTSDRDTSRVNP